MLLLAHPFDKVVISLKSVDNQLCAETSLVLLVALSDFNFFSYFVLLSKVVSAHAQKSNSNSTF